MTTMIENKISDSEKAVRQFMTRIGGILGVFDMYGMGVYIPEVKEQIRAHALELHRRLDKISKKEKLNGKGI